ncbi:MAG: DUF748 domain-containing protein [Alphaproteobacteria bacterium]|nr:DUF748 domain-containing protein [Alphaproteobacteria bacterium]
MSAEKNLSGDPWRAYRWMLGIAGTAGLLGLALWLGPSAGLRYGLLRGIEVAGYRVVELAQARVSLIDRRIDIGGLRIAGPGNVRLQAAGIEVSFSELLHGRIDIPHLRVDGLALDLERTKGHWRLSGFDLTGGSPPVSGVVRPTVRIGQVDIANADLTIHDGSTELRAKLNSATLLNFGTADSAKVDFIVDGSIADRKITANGTASPFAASPNIEAHVELSGIKIEPIAEIADLKVGGVLDFSGDVRAGLPEGASISGTARVTGGKFGMQSAASLDWKGNVQLPPGGALLVGGTLAAKTLQIDASDLKIGIATAAFDGSLKVGRTGMLVGTLTLSDADFKSAGDSLSARDGRIEMPAVSIGDDGALSGKTTVTLGGLSYSGQAGKGASEKLEMSGKFTASARTTDFDGKLELLAPRYDASDVALEAASAAVTDLSLKLAGSDGTAKLVLTIERPTMRTALVIAGGERVAFAGGIGIGANGAMSSQGKVDATRLRVELREADATATLDGLAFEGTTGMANAGPTLEGSLKATKISVVDSTARELFAAAGVETAGANYDGSGLSAARVIVNEPRVLRREKALEGREAFGWRLRAARAEIQGARLAPTGAAAIELVRVTGPVMRITRTKKGFLSFERGAPPVADAKTPPPAPSPGLAIGRFEIADGRAIFEDRTPHETVRVPVDKLALNVQDIDIGRPERPTAVVLAGRVGSFGQIAVRGAVYPFDTRLSFDLDVALKSVELPMISPYFDDKLGVDVRTGTATIDGHVVARQEKLSGNSKWRLANVRIDDRDGAENSLSAQAGVPVETILSLLADGENNIALDIPISGELSNPDFDTGDAVRQAVGGALSGALSNTLTVLFPFGTFISAAIDSERRGTAIAIPDVKFAPGDAGLDAAASGVVDGLAKLLAARPAARLEVCGFAGPADVPAIPRRPGARPVDDDLLRRLAERRAEAVKRRLVEGSGIDAERIFECRPVAEDGASAKPRAELRF